MILIRALVVDDEKPGRERVRRLLARDARVELVGCSASGAEAIEHVRQSVRAATPIHVMFLDVQMPEIDGFAVASALATELEPGAAPAVIFVTAHDEYALRAFETHAIELSVEALFRRAVPGRARSGDPSHQGRTR